MGHGDMGDGGIVPYALLDTLGIDGGVRVMVLADIWQADGMGACGHTYAVSAIGDDEEHVIRRESATQEGFDTIRATSGHERDDNVRCCRHHAAKGDAYGVDGVRKARIARGIVVEHTLAGGVCCRERTGCHEEGCLPLAVALLVAPLVAPLAAPLAASVCCHMGVVIWLLSRHYYGSSLTL